MLGEGLSESDWFFDVIWFTEKQAGSFWIQNISLVKLKLMNTNTRNLIFTFICQSIINPDTTDFWSKRDRGRSWQWGISCDSLLIPKTRLFNLGDQNFLDFWSYWLNTLFCSNTHSASQITNWPRILSELPYERYLLYYLKKKTFTKFSAWNLLFILSVWVGLPTGDLVYLNKSSSTIHLLAQCNTNHCSHYRFLQSLRS